MTIGSKKSKVMMYCNKPNLPEVGKLYRLFCLDGNIELVEQYYYPFKSDGSPYEVCDSSRTFIYNSRRDILVCLPPHVSAIGRQYQKFLVSGSGEVLVWEDNPELWLTTTEKMWMPDGFVVYWLEEVKTEEE